MIVYRVQNDGGRGPYGPGCAYPYRFPDNDSAHPLMPEAVTRGLFFGFASLDDLLAWFDEPRRAWLEGHGYGVIMAEVDGDKVIQGKGQVAFPLPSTWDRVPWPVRRET